MEKKNTFPLLQVVLVLPLAILYLAGFLFLQDRVTDEKYLKPIQVNLQGSPRNQLAPHLLRFAPSLPDPDDLGPLEAVGGSWKGSSSRIFRTLGVKFPPGWDFVTTEISLDIGGKTYLFNQESDWEKKKLVDESSVWILRTPPTFSKSMLTLVSSQFKVMNWPGDSKILFALFVDKPHLFLVPFFLFLLSIFLLFQPQIAGKLFFLSLEFWKNLSGKQKSWLFFLVLFAVALFIRWPSFDSMTNLDESTFIVMGDRMNHGDVLYRDIWDTKSPGFFFFYSLVLLPFRSVFFLKIVSALLTATTGFFLGKLAVQLTQQKKIGTAENPGLATPDSFLWLVGVVYVFVSCINDWNLSVCPENLVVFFTTLAFLMVLKGKPLALFLAGILLSASFLTKYTAGLDFAGLGLFWLISSLREKKNFLLLVTEGLGATAGFLLPIAVVALAFQISGNGSYLFKDNLYFDLTVYAQKATVGSILDSLKMVFVFPWPYLGWSLVASVFFLFRRKNFFSYKLAVSILGVVTLIGVLATGRTSISYWFQFWGVFSLTLPILFLKQKPSQDQATQAKQRAFCLGVGLVLSGLLLFNFTFEKWAKENQSAAVSDFIRPRLQPGDEIFVPQNGNVQLAYFYLDRKPPTKYVNGFAVPAGEWESVFSRHPKFVISGDFSFPERWKKELEAYYLANRIGSIRIYQVKP